MVDDPTKPLLAQSSTTFRLSCGVRARVLSPRGRVWALLTDASGFPRWNTTVTSIEGEIALGQKLALRVPIADRTFKLAVSVFEPERTMVWRDGFAPMFQGVRTFTLEDAPDGATDFEMVEVFSGLMLPMIKGSLPDFGPSFQQYAVDLQQAAQEKQP